MRSAQRKRIVLEAKARYSAVIREFAAIGEAQVLGPVIREKRITELLGALAAGAELGTDLRRALERAAERPLTLTQWLRRNQGVVRKLIKEK
jgi:hypothetical protein